MVQSTLKIGKITDNLANAAGRAFVISRCFRHPLPLVFSSCATSHLFYIPYVLCAGGPKLKTSRRIPITVGRTLRDCHIRQGAWSLSQKGFLLLTSGYIMFPFLRETVPAFHCRYSSSSVTLQSPCQRPLYLLLLRSALPLMMLFVHVLSISILPRVAMATTLLLPNV